MPKPKLLLTLPAAIAAGLLLIGGPALAAAPRVPIERVATLQVPGKPLRKFDIGSVDAAGVYAFADRSNAGLDMYNAATGRYLGRAGGFDHGGPHGVVAVGPDQFWAGAGESMVKVVDAATRQVVAGISTGGRGMVDELAYDPRDHLVVAVNTDDSPPFVSFISTRTHKVLGRVPLRQATRGAEVPAWDPVTGLIYESIPELDHHEARGAIAVFDPRSRTLIKMLPVSRCMPAGLAVGPQGNLLIGCSDDAVAAGFPARSYVMSAVSGRVIARLPQVGGSDEVWSNDRAGLYYLAAVANRGGPVLGLVDSLTDRWIANLPTGPSAHSVAADPRSGKVFVPIAAGAGGGACARGCIAVFGPAAANRGGS